MGRRNSEILTFQKSLGFGQSGENRIAKWFVRKGYGVLPVYDVEGQDFKGPRLFTAEREYAAPDFLAFKGARILWVEAKRKSVFTWHRISGKWTTGIDLHHYRHYIEISKLYPWPVWVLFLHEIAETPEGDGNSPIGLYGEQLAFLQSNENHRHSNWGKSGMVYWAETSLRKLAEIHDL